MAKIFDHTSLTLFTQGASQLPGSVKQLFTNRHSLIYREVTQQRLFVEKDGGGGNSKNIYIYFLPYTCL